MAENNLKPGSKENSKARVEILASIRQNLALSEPLNAKHRKGHRGGVSRSIKPIYAGAPPRKTLIENFRTSLEAVGGKFLLVDNRTHIGKTVREIIEKNGADRVAFSDSEFSADLAGLSGSKLLKNASVEQLFECGLGITSAQWAIAETGTLVLESDRERHRLTSLVPAAHVCVVKASSIRQTLGEVLALTSRDLSRTVTFITGASRTSDIELTLAIGVHGPGELYVILVENE